MTGSSRAACTMANPIRWVNEVFLPAAASAALSALRRASSVATATSRNDVAVGTESEASMFWTRRAAGPVIGLAPEGESGEGRGTLARRRGAPPQPRLALSLLQYFFPTRRDHWQIAQSPVAEQRPPFLRDRRGVAEELLVHDLHEGGVMGAEDELAHGEESNAPANGVGLRARLALGRPSDGAGEAPEDQDVGGPEQVPVEPARPPARDGNRRAA